MFSVFRLFWIQVCCTIKYTLGSTGYLYLNQIILLILILCFHEFSGWIQTYEPQIQTVCAESFCWIYAESHFILNLSFQNKTEIVRSMLRFQLTLQTSLRNISVFLSSRLIESIYTTNSLSNRYHDLKCWVWCSLGWIFSADNQMIAESLLRHSVFKLLIRHFSLLQKYHIFSVVLIIFTM